MQAGDVEMSSLKQDLIKLGNTNPELREDIRAILKVSSSQQNMEDAVGIIRDDLKLEDQNSFQLLFIYIDNYLRAPKKMQKLLDRQPSELHAQHAAPSILLKEMIEVLDSISAHSAKCSKVLRRRIGM